MKTLILFSLFLTISSFAKSEGDNSQLIRKLIRKIETVGKVDSHLYQLAKTDFEEVKEHACKLIETKLNDIKDDDYGGNKQDIELETNESRLQYYKKIYKQNFYHFNNKIYKNLSKLGIKEETFCPNSGKVVYDLIDDIDVFFSDDIEIFFKEERLQQDRKVDLQFKTCSKSFVSWFIRREAKNATKIGASYDFGEVRGMCSLVLKVRPGVLSKTIEIRIKDGEKNQAYEGPIDEVLALFN